ncbi:sulfatase-like hydrolase/transferase [bacterium]|nr:sulfatase-like hydrolase/transferase [bacterium]MCI0604449.1 sulfatase-like hydrolase/transferase [bacterium]
MSKKKGKKQSSAGVSPARSAQTGRPRYSVAIVIGIVFLVLILGYGAFHFSFKNKGEQENSASYNVLLVSMDTVRADYLRLYDAEGVETPHLEKLAKEGILFKKAISQIPYTLPSHTSMFTGLHPVAHGVRDNVEDVLRKEIPTIAETFLKHGYNTAGFVGSMVLNRTTGLARGFEYYDDFLSRADVRGEDLGAIERRAQEVFYSFQNWQGKRTEQKPFFAFLHFYDPHDPYDPPSTFSPKEDTAQERYKGEIRYVDYVLGELFEFLRNRNLWDNTVLVITSDHGEMLQEHGEIGHGYFLYQPALAVPLIFHLPGQKQSKAISNVVQLVDVPSTILELSGVPVPGEMQGESLVPLLEGESGRKNRFALSESYFASIQLGVSPIFSIQDSSWKYIDSPQAELYDLAKDPAESKNIIEEKKSLSQQMKQKLVQYGERNRASAAKPSEKRSITPEQAEQFAALGYLGGSFSEEKWDFRKDPKDYIDDWTRILEATNLTMHGQYAEALSVIDQIAKDAGTLTDPILILQSKCLAGLGKFGEAEKILKQLGDTPAASTFLAGIYTSTGRDKEASEAYQRALQQRFSYFVLYNYVLFLKRTDRKQEALDLVNQVQQTRGDTDQAKPLLAEIYFLLERWEKAEELLLALVQDRPWEAKWYVQLASLYQTQNQPRKALDLLLKKYDTFSNNAEYLLRLGILFRAVGDGPREIATFQKMIQIARRDPRGYFYLAKALLDHNRNAEAAIQLSNHGFLLNPDPAIQIFGHYVLSDAYQSAGKLSEAEKEIQLAQKMEKDRL